MYHEWEAEQCIKHVGKANGKIPIVRYGLEF